jgi:hypothetical protein
MDLGKIGWSVMNWIDQVQDRDQWRVLVNTVFNLRVPSNVGKFLSMYTIGSLSRIAQLHGASYLIIHVKFKCTGDNS